MSSGVASVTVKLYWLNRPSAPHYSRDQFVIDVDALQVQFVPVEQAAVQEGDLPYHDFCRGVSLVLRSVHSFVKEDGESVRVEVGLFLVFLVFLIVGPQCLEVVGVVVPGCPAFLADEMDEEEPVEQGLGELLSLLFLHCFGESLSYRLVVGCLVVR